ncbi:hypothetical protein, partial [Thiolapillus sp.]|uniref:hypothetical protein n=1 Tax=Thiolapillus sp. TaxID=2017437 RepID=UPI003AF5643A
AGCSNQRIEQALTGSMNKIATLFHPKIYGGTMLLTLNSSSLLSAGKTGAVLSCQQSANSGAVNNVKKDGVFIQGR